MSEFGAKEPANEAGNPVALVLMLQVCTISAPEVILSLENVINMNHLVNFAVVYFAEQSYLFAPENYLFMCLLTAGYF